MCAPGFRLNDGVHLCETGGRFVILDLARDRYLGLADRQADALRDALARDVWDPQDASHARDALQPLVDSGVLIDSSERGRPLAVTSIEPPRASLLDDVRIADARITPGRVARFITACVSARRRLRRRPIGETVEHVGCLAAHCCTTATLAAARDITATFLRLRPLYPLDRWCLFEALALIELLAHWRIHPSWVFGVRLDPWRAHCWVQHAGVLFNDDLNEVLQYTPIMAVEVGGRWRCCASSS